MQELEYKNIAEKAYQNLKNGTIINDDLALKLNSIPQIDYCRSLIKDDDADWLKRLASSSSVASLVRELCISLMHPLCRKNDRDTREYLEGLWKSSDQYNIRMQVMWRLLDYDDLPVNLHRDIYKNFIVPNWDKWLPYIVEKFGGKEKVFPSCNKRLQDPAFPSSKAWVYLCVASGCKKEEMPEVKKMIKQYLSSKDSINSEVAENILKKL